MLRHFKMEMLKRSQAELARQEERAQMLAPTATMPTGVISAASMINGQSQLATLEAHQPSRHNNNLQPLKQSQHNHRPAATAAAAAASTIGAQLVVGDANKVMTTSRKSATATQAGLGANQRSGNRGASGGGGGGSRSRRASKPQMEKRRRARINECLGILKSYVMTDSTNLNQLGIDPAASENQDEETIARAILKSSGLIHRHKGRKNPNKLEKADILELTVDYVRRLHEQRDELMLNNTNLLQNNQVVNYKLMQTNNETDNISESMLVVPAHFSQPLTLDLSPKSRLPHQRAPNDLFTSSRGQLFGNHPPTPPPSSASSIQSSGDESSSSPAIKANDPQALIARVLDNYKLYDVNQFAHQNQQYRC